MEINLIKTLSGLVPYDSDSEAWYNKLKTGSVIHADFKKYRNPVFHRKYFALLNIGYQNWEPGEINSRYGTPEKNFTTFRKDVAILCGYYKNVIRFDGTSRIEAESISFSKMEQEEFETLYSKTIDLFINNIYGTSLDADGLNDIVNKYLTFA